MPVVKLISPSRFISEENIALAVERCKRFGLDLLISEGCRSRYHQFAGTDEQRATDFITAWNGNDSDILWCARGGYGSGRLLALVRGKLQANEKTIIGYSDQTFLLAHIAKNGLGTAVHGPMAIDLLKPDYHPAVDELLAKAVQQDFTFQINNQSVETLIPGRAKGTAIVGNLTILTRLIGTPDEPDWDRAILMVEDVDEYLYAIDRMFVHLAEAGILDRIAGLVLGGFTGIQDNELPFGHTVAEMALLHLRGRKIPVAQGLPIGHGPDNRPIVFGGMCTLVCDASTARIDVAGYA